VNNQDNTWQTIQQWQDKSFILAAILFLAFAIFEALTSYAGIIIPERLTILTHMLGLGAAIVGLVGFYPYLKEHASTLTKSGLAALLIAGISILAIAVAALITGGPESAGETLNSVMPIFVFGGIIGMAAAFALFSAAGFRSKAFSDTISGLLLLPALAWVSPLIVTLITGGNPDFVVILVYAVNSVIMGTVGYLVNAEEETETAPRFSD
jgi:hypothetical protein